MTKPRLKPSTQFLAFLVEPEPGFQPSNWQQNPDHYRILEFVGPKYFKGRADAWKFLHNHDQMNCESIQQWAIYLDIDSPIFGLQLTKENPNAIEIQPHNGLKGRIAVLSVFFCVDPGAGKN